MGDVLDKFSSLFAEPHWLPPVWDHCHRIHPKKGTGTIVVRPYCYAQLQEDELERQCAKMLQHGTICHNTSAFSSSVLLIKKADGSWHFCVDYHALNAKIIKYKFPIPIVEKLLDGPCGANFFYQTRFALSLSSSIDAPDGY